MKQHTATPPPTAASAVPQPLADLRKLIHAHEVPSVIKAHTIELTPDLAKEFLKRNVNISLPGRATPLHNRKINKNNVEYLKRCIQQDLMLNTGEPLIFTVRGEGIDLQHRCQAVIEANKGYTTTVITGLDVETPKLLDLLLVMGQAAKRTSQQLSDMVGVKMALWEAVKYFNIPYDVKSGTMETAVTKLELQIKFNENPSFYQAGLEKVATLFNADSDNASELGRNRIPIYTAAYLKMTQIDPAMAEKFITAFLTKANTLPKGNPIDELRKQLTRVFDMGVRDKAKPLMVREVLLQAFSDFIQYEKNAEASAKWNYNLVGKRAKVKVAKRPYHRRKPVAPPAGEAAGEVTSQPTTFESNGVVLTTMPPTTVAAASATTQAA